MFIKCIDLSRPPTPYGWFILHAKSCRYKIKSLTEEESKVMRESIVYEYTFFDMYPDEWFSRDMAHLSEEEKKRPYEYILLECSNIDGTTTFISTRGTVYLLNDQGQTIDKIEIRYVN